MNYGQTLIKCKFCINTVATEHCQKIEHDDRKIQLGTCYTSTGLNKLCLRVEFKTVTKFTWMLKTQNLQSCLNALS